MCELRNEYINVAGCEKNNLNGMQMYKVYSQWTINRSRTYRFLLEEQTFYLSYLKWWLLSSSSTNVWQFRWVLKSKRNYYGVEKPLKNAAFYWYPINFIRYEVIKEKFPVCSRDLGQWSTTWNGNSINSLLTETRDFRSNWVNIPETLILNIFFFFESYYSKLISFYQTL